MAMNWSRPNSGYESEPWRTAATGRWDATKSRKKAKKTTKTVKPNPHLKHLAEVREGRGPHAGQLFCLECQRHIMWLSQKECKLAKEIQNG